MGICRVEVDQALNNLVHVDAVDFIVIEGPFEAEAEDLLWWQEVWYWVADNEFEDVGEFGLDFGGKAWWMGFEVGEGRGLVLDWLGDNELDFVDEEGFVVGGFVVFQELGSVVFEFFIIALLEVLQII